MTASLRRIPCPRLTLCVAGFLWALTAHADIGLRDGVQLTELLKRQPPCCVIDARAQAAQDSHPVADTLRYRPGIKIIPTASVIVLADTDQQAMRVVLGLSKQHPGKDIYAVKGGAAAWESVRKSLEKVTSSQAPGAPAALSFVIPHNTCETGAPLQVLSGGKPKP